MPRYCRVMAGRGGEYIKDCLDGEFIGTDFDIKEDISPALTGTKQSFILRYRPELEAADPNLKRIGAGLRCAHLWSVSKGLQVGDCILSPTGDGHYAVGYITGNYRYVAAAKLPHQRPVNWLEKRITKAEMSEKLQNAAGAQGTSAYVDSYASEIERLIKGDDDSGVFTNDPDVENPLVFAMEKWLEDFIVSNWDATMFGSNYKIYGGEDDPLAGKQYGTDIGTIDILAISNDGNEFLVVELKRSHVSDRAVGQVQRYMGWVKEALATDGQLVRGAIIGLDDDPQLRYALMVTQNIEFYRYEVKFSLNKVAINS